MSDWFAIAAVLAAVGTSCLALIFWRDARALRRQREADLIGSVRARRRITQLEAELAVWKPKRAPGGQFTAKSKEPLEQG